MSETFLIVSRDGKFYVRHVAFTTEDRIRGEMVYRCDAPGGGSFDTLEEAAGAMREAERTFYVRPVTDQCARCWARGTEPCVVCNYPLPRPTDS